MKKKLALVMATVLTLSLSLSMTGCIDDKIAKLAPDYKGKYNISVIETIQGLSSANYSFGATDDNGLVVVSRTNERITTYQLFDIVSQQLIPGTASVNPIMLLDEGLFYSASNDGLTTNYTLYSRKGQLAMGAGSVSNNGIFTSAATGVRTYVDIKGEITEEKYPFNEIFNKSKADDCVKVGKYYLSGDFDGGDSYYDADTSNIVVYNSKGKKVRTINPTLRLGLSSNSKLDFFEAEWSIGNKLFFQVTTELPYMENSYDYYKNGNKYDIVTYSYDVKSDKLSKVKGFAYEVQDVYSTNESNVVLEVCEIKNKQIIKQPFLQAFNSRGKVSIDIQGLVPGADEYGYNPVSGFSFLRAAGYTHVYNGNKHLRTLDSDYSVVGECILTTSRDETTNSDTLTFYDIENAANSIQIPLVSDYDVVYNNNVLYCTTANEVCLFDTEKGGQPISKTTISNSQSLVSSNPYYFAVYDNSTLTTTYYFMDNTAPLTLNASYYNIETATYPIDGTRYQLIKAQKDGVYSYKMLAISYPYVEA